MKMKKILALIVSVLMLMGIFAGCSKPAEEDTDTDPEVTTPAAEENPGTAEDTEPGTTPNAEPQEEPAAKDILNVANYSSSWQLLPAGSVEIMGSDHGTAISTGVYLESGIYALKNILYVENPTVSGNLPVQLMSIYVPEAYLTKSDDGSVSVNKDGSMTATFYEQDGVTETGTYTWTAETAPIVFLNTVDGYAGSSNFDIGGSKAGLSYGGFIDKGFIVVSAQTRGIGSMGSSSTTDMDGNVVGKAPSGIVDLKAVIAYLKYNDENLPGDSEKIFVSGASAGGAMSALLGASGDSEDYKPYLEELGAADASDSVYASMVFCPITDLDEADAAYEWLHKYQTESAGPGGNMGGNNAGGDTANAEDNTSGPPANGPLDTGNAGGDTAEDDASGPPNGGAGNEDNAGGDTANDDGIVAGTGPITIASGPFGEFDMALHNALIDVYVDYITSLGFDLEEGGEGGEYYTALLDKFVEAMNHAVTLGTNEGQIVTPQEVIEAVAAKDSKLEEYLAENHIALSDVLSWNEEAQSFELASIGIFDMGGTYSRIKGVPSFNNSTEASLFGPNGTQDDGKVNFSTAYVEALKILMESENEEIAAEAKKTYDEISAEVESVVASGITNLMNPMYYLTGQSDSTKAQYWRFNIGTSDSDQGTTAAWVMYNELRSLGNGFTTEFNLIYGAPHGAADYYTPVSGSTYTANEFMSWIAMAASGDAVSD